MVIRETPDITGVVFKKTYCHLSTNEKLSVTELTVFRDYEVITYIMAMVRKDVVNQCLESDTTSVSEPET